MPTLCFSIFIVFFQEAVKNLNSIIDSSDFLHALDDQTLRLHPTAAVKSKLLKNCSHNGTDVYAQHFYLLFVPSFVATTWPGLINKFAGYALDQIHAAHQKGKTVEANVSGTMRRLVTLAEDEKRTGTKHIPSDTILKRKCIL